MRNVGRPGQAGSIAAAMLLREFVGDVPWAHLDIAGPARSDENSRYLTKGGTGFGVRTPGGADHQSEEFAALGLALGRRKSRSASSVDTEASGNGTTTLHYRLARGRIAVLGGGIVGTDGGLAGRPQRHDTVLWARNPEVAAVRSTPPTPTPPISPDSTSNPPN